MATATIQESISSTAAAATADSAVRPSLRVGGRSGWSAAFVVLAAGAFVLADVFTGLNVVAATGRFLWNAAALVANSMTHATGGLLGLIAKGIGWRRLSRVGSAVTGVGLSYSGAVLLSEHNLRRAKGWSGKLKAALAIIRRIWLNLHLVWKLAVVAALIASQVYLHSLLILFPIAFLVPVVRRVWMRCADLVFGGWYWRTFGRRHRAAVAALRSTPVIRHVIGAVRLVRIRYLYAWRLWRYNPTYRRADGDRRKLSLAEPFRLLGRGALDGYIGRPLLCGGRRAGRD